MSWIEKIKQQAEIGAKIELEKRKKDEAEKRKKEEQRKKDDEEKKSLAKKIFEHEFQIFLPLLNKYFEDLKQSEIIQKPKTNRIKNSTSSFHNPIIKFKSISSNYEQFSKGETLENIEHWVDNDKKAYLHVDTRQTGEFSDDCTSYYYVPALIAECSGWKITVKPIFFNKGIDSFEISLYVDHCYESNSVGQYSESNIISKETIAEDQINEALYSMTKKIVEKIFLYKILYETEE